MAYHRYYGVDTHLVRIFNTYGPRLQANDGRVISNFMMQALQRRAAHHLRRRLADPQLLLTSPTSSTASFASRAPTSIFPSTSAIPTSGPSSSAPEVLAVTGSKAEIVLFKPLPQDDPTRRRPDITKASTLLGWEPKITCVRAWRSRSNTSRACVSSRRIANLSAGHAKILAAESPYLRVS